MYISRQGLNKYLKLNLLPDLSVPGVFLLLGLVGLVAVALGRDPFTGFGPADSPTSGWGVGIASVIAVLASLIAGFFKARTTLSLLQRGDWVPGRYVSASPLRKGGQRPVTVSYQVAGVDHEIRRDMIASDVAEMETKPFIVVYDPQAPRRAMIVPPDITGQLSTQPGA
ncbi:MAG: hypothetical protein ACFCVE_15825 [Phycisphaerae bacterium]